MDQGQLVADAIEAAADLLVEFEQRFKVASAFWIHEGPEGRSDRLYVALQDFNTNLQLAALDELHRIRRELLHPDFDPMRVSFIPTDDPKARDAAELLAVYPGRYAIRRKDRMFGDRFAVEIYLYPNPVSSTGTRISRVNPAYP